MNSVGSAIDVIELLRSALDRTEEVILYELEQRNLSKGHPESYSFPLSSAVDEMTANDLLVCLLAVEQVFGKLN